MELSSSSKMPNSICPFGELEKVSISYENEILRYINAQSIYIPVPIQQKLRSIHEYAFVGNGQVTNVRLDFPNVVRIGTRAFYASTPSSGCVVKIPNAIELPQETFTSRRFFFMDFSNVQTIQKDATKYCTVDYYYFGDRTRTDIPTLASNAQLVVNSNNSGLRITSGRTKIVVPDALHDMFLASSSWNGIGASYYMTKTQYDELGLDY